MKKDEKIDISEKATTQTFDEALEKVAKIERTTWLMLAEELRKRRKQTKKTSGEAMRERVIAWLKAQPDGVIAGITALIIFVPAVIVGIIFGK